MGDGVWLTTACRARRWIEKSQAEERTEAALTRIAELEQTVSAWESWHQSQRRQQRQRRHQAMRAQPDAMLRTLLADWGVQVTTAAIVLLRPVAMALLLLLPTESASQSAQT